MLPGGGKQWLVRYQTADGKRSKVVIGTYPDLSVAQAHGNAADVHLAARTGTPIVGMRRGAGQGCQSVRC
ncbi:Arm DNA-binding domain-containing protein [Achromobacter marplatensis]|uniref:Arm DNA-binding domain-containing protein n=1 Tax=Achromobacter marplatensis TaxID=470868 RepID=UPI001F18BA9A|nr:Arm DNA-binding domain-containing protein [Achromobacter marplatensis]